MISKVLNMIKQFKLYNLHHRSFVILSQIHLFINYQNSMNFLPGLEIRNLAPRCGVINCYLSMKKKFKKLSTTLLLFGVVEKVQFHSQFSCIGITCTQGVFNLSSCHLLEVQKVIKTVVCSIGEWRATFEKNYVCM